MSKYNIYSTREDWERLYRAVKKAGLDVKPFKKSQSYDGACVMYAEATGDYSLKNLEVKKMKIIIDLREMSKEAAQDILNEIEDKMLPDYSDCIKSMRIEE